MTYPAWREVAIFGLPEKDGEYLVRRASGHMAIHVSFCKEEQAFNCHPGCTDYAWRDVIAWVPVEELWPSTK